MKKTVFLDLIICNTIIARCTHFKPEGTLGTSLFTKDPI